VLLLLGLVLMLPVLALEVAGFVILAQKMPWAAVFADGVLTHFLLLNGPIATPKSRLPFEPVLIVFYAISLVMLLKLDDQGSVVTTDE
jgi:hypothetical protein